MASVPGAHHLAAMRISTEITRTLRGMYWPEAMMISPAEVITVLNEADVGFILMGNYGITGWRGEERATQDVDVLVRKRDHARAVRAIRASFPLLKMEDYPPVTRFLDPSTEKPLIDLMKPTEPLFKVAFRQTILVEGGYHVPNLEFALACKFAAMVSPNRAEERKLQDAADFTFIVKRNREAIRSSRLKRLGERVYQGGGTEIAQFVENVKAGRRLEF